MEKRTIFLELSSEIIDRIDQSNNLGDRSLFVSNLLEKQLQQDSMGLDVSTELTTRYVFSTTGRTTDLTSQPTIRVARRSNAAAIYFFISVSFLVNIYNK